MSRRPTLFVALLAALLTALLLFCSRPVAACLNDRDSDSLAYEARQLPDLVAVITGRFPRNPALFYEMRLTRVAGEIAAHPDRLNLYDDAAVACDHLGRDDAAITWITKKRQRLEKRDRHDPEVKKHWYRYYANVGTFRVHRWLKAGASDKHLAELTQAISEIRKAIQLKPNAHFGREKYQLAVMEALLAHRRDPKVEVVLNKYLADHTKDTPEATIEGLSGLIVLGAAWESPDIFGALGAQVARNKSYKLQYLAGLRCLELLENGKSSLFNTEREDKKNQARYLTGSRRGITNAENIEAKYQELRFEAEQWHEQRTAYLLARLQNGHHPDTDPAFWKDYHPATQPTLAIPWRDEIGQNFGNALGRYFFVAIGYVFIAAIGLLLYGLVRTMSPRSQKSAKIGE